MNKSDKILQEDGVEIEQIEDNSDVSNVGEIIEPFDPKKVGITTKQLIIYAILKKIHDKYIDLNLSFRQDGNLWDKTKQSRLIESILINLPLPPFYFDGSDDNNWFVIDGLQRITALKNYIIDKNFSLQNLEYLKKFDGYKFDDLPRYFQRRIEEHAITVYIINPGTPEEVKFNLFKRINTGGLVLTAQEIRHAFNQGIPAEFINELAELEEFKRYGITTKRMLDKDFITRFISFYIHTLDEYKPSLDNFLNTSLSKLKTLSDKEREQIKADFKKALQASFDIFGKYAYRKQYSIDDKIKPINKALFETCNIALCRLKEDEIKTIVEKKNILIRKFIELLNKDEEFEKSIISSADGRKQVEKRFSSIENLIKEALK